MTVAEVGWFAAGFYPDRSFLDRYRKQATEFALPMDRQLKKLSKGMRSKVALSLALANEPRLLILDEPTSGLDAMVRRDFLESMVDLTADGRTVFLSSHQIHEVRLSLRIRVLGIGHPLHSRHWDTVFPVGKAPVGGESTCQ